MIRCLCLLLASQVLVRPATVSAGELFRESFDAGKSKEWQHAWGPSEISDERAHEGRHSLKEMPEDKYGYSVLFRDVPAKPLQYYTFSAYVFIPSDQPKRPTARLSINTTKWGALADAHTAELDRWVKLTASYTNAKHEVLRFELMQARQQAGLGGAVMFWDSVVCTVESGVERMKKLKGRSPHVLEGLEVSPAGGLSIKVSPGRCRVHGRVVAVTSESILRFSPAAVHTVRNEQHRLVADKPTGWAKGTRLKLCVGAGPTLPGCYAPGSVVVKPAPDGEPYQIGKDYLVDEGWGLLGRVAGARIDADTVVYVDYAYSLCRLDTLQVSPEGRVSLRTGQEAKTCPHPAGVQEGHLALANIFVNYNALELGECDIFPIAAPLPPATPEELANKASRVPKARHKLESGGKLRIGFWGDSVTCGGDASRPDRRFPDGFVLELRKKYPAAQVEFFNAGIGGSSTRGRLPDLGRDVIAKKPDLVVVEFVNDMGLSPSLMREHYYDAIGQIRAVGGEVILITPHFTMPSMMRFGALWETDRRPACQALREIAEEKKVGLADAARV